MPLQTIEDIKGAIAAKEADLGELRERMNGDFDLLTLQEYQSRKGYESYTSSAPKNFFDKVTDGLNRATVTIQIKLPEKAKDKAKKAASDGELFLFGALAAIDRQLIASGEPPLREQLGLYICLRGWYAVKLLVYVPKGEKVTRFDAQPWDPIHMTWERGRDGLIWAAYKTNVTKAQAEDEYGMEIAGKEAVKIDFFNKTMNAVIIGNEWAKAPEDHNIDHVPVHIGAVGSMPTLQPSATTTAGSSDPEASLIRYRGDSVWSASRDLYESHNKYVSTLMDTQKRATVGSLVHASTGGEKTLKGDPYRSFQIIPIDSNGESIRPLDLPTAPPETAAILGLINADIQQSTLPYPLAYGGTTEAMSGVALSKLEDATRSVYSPRTGAMARTYSWLCEELLIQFSKKIDRPSTLRGFKPDDEVFFEVTAKPKSIDPDWFVSISVEPRMPRDRESEISMALAATSRRGPDDIPLMSKETARETILRLRDPHSEEGRALVEIGKSMPAVMAAEVAAALQRNGESELAQRVLESVGGGKVPPELMGGAPPPTNGQAPPPPGALPPGAPPTPAGAPPQQSPVDQVFQAVIEVLNRAGRPEMAQQFMAAATAGQLTQEILQPLAELLMQMGEQQLLGALFEILGIQPPEGLGPPTPAAIAGQQPAQI